MDFCISHNIDQTISLAEWYPTIRKFGFAALALKEDLAHCSYQEHTGRLQLLAEASHNNLRHTMLFVPAVADYDISCRHGETRMGAVCATANAIYAAKALGCQAVVLSVTHALPSKHGSDTPSVLHALEGLVETAEIMGINLLLRNLIDSKSLATLDAALAEYPSARFGVCYNPALDLLSQQPPYRILEQYSERIYAMQLADSDRIASYQMMPFSGLVDWHRVASFLAASNHNPPLHFDVARPADAAPESFMAALRVCADRFAELARLD